MKRLIQLNVLLLLISSATAQELPVQNLPKVLRTYDWKDLNLQYTNCQIVSMDGMQVLKIENTNDTPRDFLLLKISNPSIIKNARFYNYEVKCENIEGGDFNLQSRFPPRASGGDVTNIRNDDPDKLWRSINWRLHQLSFIPKGFEEWPTWLPTQSEIWFHLSGRGTVYIRPIKLLGVVGSWWSPRQSGLIGGIGGSAIGCFGALIGLLASKGKARNFVLTSIKISIVVGILLMIAGLVALVCKQPYAVWYALLLPGVILTSVFSLNLSSLQRRYDELEIRRMTSVDTMGS